MTSRADTGSVSGNRVYRDLGDYFRFADNSPRTIALLVCLRKGINWIRSLFAQLGEGGTQRSARNLDQSPVGRVHF
jgi:hypothetical protein